MFADKLRELRERATKYNDVEVMWYHVKQKDGTTIAHPQFETDGGYIAQEESDYDLYCFLANHAEQIEELVRAAHSAHQTLADEGFHAKAIRLGQALAALEKEQS